MSGRGDNNKHGTSGQGASNQSNQPFVTSDNKEKSNHGKQTGGQPSEPQHQQRDQASNRNTSVDSDQQ